MVFLVLRSARTGVGVGGAVSSGCSPCCGCGAEAAASEEAKPPSGAGAAGATCRPRAAAAAAGCLHRRGDAAGHDDDDDGGGDAPGRGAEVTAPAPGASPEEAAAPAVDRLQLHDIEEEDNEEEHSSSSTLRHAPRPRGGSTPSPTFSQHGKSRSKRKGRARSTTSSTSTETSTSVAASGAASGASSAAGSFSGASGGSGSVKMQAEQGSIGDLQRYHNRYLRSRRHTLANRCPMLAMVVLYECDEDRGVKAIFGIARLCCSGGGGGGEDGCGGVPKYEPCSFKYRDFKHCDMDNLREDALNAPWEDLLKLDCINEKVARFNEILIGLYDKHAPVVTARPTKETGPKWMTNKIRSLIKQRDEAYCLYRKNKCEFYRASFKNMRNRTKQEIRNSKLRHAQSLFESVKTSKDMWNSLKKLKVISNPAPCRNGPLPDELNANFVNVEVKNEDLIQSNIKFYEAQFKPEREDFHFSYVTPEDVIKAVLSIGSNAKGVDEIPASFIKNCLYELTPAILHICNHSLQHCVFPDLWKIAVVKPLPKKSNPSTLKDYRPISLLCVISKILEKIVHTQISKYLTMYNILNPLQSGFKSQHSTSTALMKVSNDLRDAMDKRQVSILVLYDFSNAFPSVHHGLLLAKLKWLGFSNSVWSFSAESTTV
ncbi:putative RNA-directed DNA polymerase from transposon BS [Frankliniella fusca]|uniref:RNA-directed DNA polymerase from transposon BS n=1 Tax=Frankliniella fusca TaxID=407009 RepID=A0AAE1HD28_9NEOP|nr:putative RNA-directed DNA polymerase from transposon BS [Frankliniella fusca]